MTDQGAPTSLRVGVSRTGLLVPLLVLAVLAGCGGGERITETRQVAPFNRLDVNESVDVKVVPGDGREVRVYAGEHVIDRVVTESSGGVLEIGVRDRGIVIGSDPLDDVEVEVQASALEGVDIDGSGDVVLEGLDAPELELTLDGAADVDASGTVDRLIATIEGAGDANLLDLRARTARVVVEGAGDAELNVSDELDVSVEGAADVSYTGDPRIRSDVSGAGDIRRIEP
jgi:Putative auto-transporter adhesin, head GIN domain